MKNNKSINNDMTQDKKPDNTINKEKINNENKQDIHNDTHLQDSKSSYTQTLHLQGTKINPSQIQNPKNIINKDDIFQSNLSNDLSALILIIIFQMMIIIYIIISMLIKIFQMYHFLI